MSQPPFQPPPQQPQPPHNPYNHPVPPQQQPGFGPPPVPGQPPMQAGSPPSPGPLMQAWPPPVPGQPPVQPIQPGPPPLGSPFGQQPSADGNPVGAVFLGFFASVVVSLIYTIINVATAEDQSKTVGNTLYLLHALLNGVIVGALVGLVGRRSNGARVGAAIIAALGTFFGYTNMVVGFFFTFGSFTSVRYMLEDDPLYPAKSWWTLHDGGVDWFSPLGLVVAAAAAWGLAYAVGKRDRRE